MDAITISNLSKTYQSRSKVNYALKNVSFSVREGEMFGLLGPNGAGKTTIINILSGLLTKDKGIITILSKDPEIEKEAVKNQMNVGAAYSFLTGILTVEQNLRVYGKLYGVKDLDQRISHLLKIFEIEDLRHKKVFILSTGQIIRVILCKGLINNPKVLLLDECTVGLDPDIAQKTRKILKDYQKEQGTTIVFTSHNMTEVEQLCDRIAFLHKGEILMIGTPKELRKRIKTQSVKIDIIGEKRKSLRSIVERFKVKVTESKLNMVIFEIRGEVELPKIINAIIKEGLEIIDINVRKPSLEDVFLKIARGEQL
ncbi:ABC transporter ATP-binding protein [Candidatus Woesearchaeota archaeon]|nr:ABC transporter ATP-binding protein [Candidatus Woesearchaeota archaeon]